MPTDTLIINGKKYMSVEKAADLAGYTSEYVSKLSRDGFIGGKQMGKTSYVDFDSFADHMHEHGGSHTSIFSENVDRDHSLRALRAQERDMSGRVKARDAGGRVSRSESVVGTRQGVQFAKSPTGSRLGVRAAHGSSGALRSVRRGTMFLLIFAGVAYGWGYMRSQVNTDEIFSTMEVLVENLATAVSEWRPPHTFLSGENTEVQQAAVIESRNAFSCPVCEKVEKLFQ
ncbi:MAG: hypothetical protein H8D63_02770 [Parcubacteria group bacterium]|nr:hypothetical protein [Parcubacteria group bacterium]